MYASNPSAQFCLENIKWNFVIIQSASLTMMQLTGLVLQCTDVGWGRPRHCAVPPTSPQTLGDTEAERLPSWRTAPWECVPRNQTWRWPQSVRPLKAQQAKNRLSVFVSVHTVKPSDALSYKAEIKAVWMCGCIKHKTQDLSHLISI